MQRKCKYYQNGRRSTTNYGERQFILSVSYGFTGLVIIRLLEMLEVELNKQAMWLYNIDVQTWYNVCLNV